VLTVLYLVQANGNTNMFGHTLKELFRSPYFRGLARPQFTRIVGKKLLNQVRWPRPAVRRHQRVAVNPFREGAHKMGWVGKPAQTLSGYALTEVGRKLMKAALQEV